MEIGPSYKISKATFTACLYSKIRKLCLGQRMRIQNRLFHCAKLDFSTPILQSFLWAVLLFSHLMIAGMVKISLKMCILFDVYLRYHIT